MAAPTTLEDRGARKSLCRDRPDPDLRTTAPSLWKGRVKNLDAEGLSYEYVIALDTLAHPLDARVPGIRQVLRGIGLRGSTPAKAIIWGV